jgi:hypothetical protein
MGEMLVHCCSGKGETYHVVLAGAKPYLHSAGRSGLPCGAGRSHTIPSLCWQVRLTTWYWQEPNHTFTLLAGQAYHVVLAGAKPYLHSAGRSGLARGTGRSQTIPSLCWQVRLTTWCWQEPNHTFTLLAGQAYHLVRTGTKRNLNYAGRLLQSAVWQTPNHSSFFSCMPAPGKVILMDEGTYRHQSFNVVFTGHFVWGGEVIW